MIALFFIRIFRASPSSIHFASSQVTPKKTSPSIFSAELAKTRTTLKQAIQDRAKSENEIEIKITENNTFNFLVGFAQGAIAGATAFYSFQFLRNFWNSRNMAPINDRGELSNSNQKNPAVRVDEIAKKLSKQEMAIDLAPFLSPV